MISSTKPNGYGHILLLHFQLAREIRIKAEGQSVDGMKLYTIPTSTAGSTGIEWKAAGKTFHHLAVEAVDQTLIAYAYEPGAENIRVYRLGPCSITMDGEPTRGS